MRHHPFRRRPLRSAAPGYGRIGAAAAAFGLTAATLTGCGSDGEEEVTLSLVAADYDVDGGQSSRAYWDGLVTAFEKKNKGIKVDVRIEPWTNVDRTVQEMVDAGQAPDIAQIGAYADYAAEDKLYDVDQLLSLGTMTNFLRPLAVAGEHRRTQYGMPFVASTRLLFYNKKLFDEAGIEEPPKTWDELRDAAERLKDNTKAVYPYALPLGPEEAQAETLNWMISAGDSYTVAGSGYTINSERNVSTVKWVKENLVDKELTGPVTPGQLNRKDAFAAFARGEVGMLNGHPSLLRIADKAGIEMGTVAIPGPDGKPQHAMGVADWVMAFKENGNRAEIGKFLDFLYTDENVMAFAAQNNLLPVTTSAFDAMREDPEYKELKGFLDELPDSVLPPVGKTSWASVSADLKKNMGRAVAPGGNPKAILDGIDKKAEEAERAEEE
ncbi:extracellular solute-binding protein [Streptomyces sp. NPDC020875]|uniref:extracellular solute-binding protein n=1 Tax=Streptomyces sp. NPDC020875 TaxID=3154898 RepID=UPI00340D4769